MESCGKTPDEMSITNGEKSLRKVNTTALRSLSNRAEQSNLTVAINESAIYIDELEQRIGILEKAINETLESMCGYDCFKYGDVLKKALINLE